MNLERYNSVDVSVDALAWFRTFQAPSICPRGLNTAAFSAAPVATPIHAIFILTVVVTGYHSFLRYPTHKLDLLRF
jgi:hypothetical protein